MDNSKWYRFMNRLTSIFSSRRMKLTLYVAVVLWMAVLTQVAVNQIFHEDIQITEAFIKSNTKDMESTLEIIAEYKNGEMADTDKKDIINKIAAAIGLTINNDYTVWSDEERSELLVYKQAKQASTQIKVVSLKENEISKNYIIIQLSLLSGIQNIDRYKKIVEEELSKLAVKEKQVILKYEGSREGELSVEEKRTVATSLITELQGDVALEYDEGDLYTVYGYTGMLKEYISSMGNKINVQVAITYNEMNDRTKIVLATPILNESY
ncbi:MAG: putative rane protein [Herbinix sp.]|jgi:hypothetical protein|nr:putative rane protein [Herbinix sp.]